MLTNGGGGWLDLELTVFYYYYCCCLGGDGFWEQSFGVGGQYM